MQSPKVSVYDGASDNIGKAVSIDAVIKRIKSGERGLDEKTRQLNRLAQTDPKDYKKKKEKLPAVSWSGHFSKRNRKGLIQHSGYVVIDVDNTLDIGSVLADFAQNPHVRFAFISPSGTGAKPIIPVSPVPTTPEEHEHAFYAVLDAFDEYVLRDPKMMKAQKDVCRLCFLAYDARPVDNPDAIPVHWEYPEETLSDKPHPSPSNPIGNKSNTQFVGKADLEALDHVPNDCDYETWRNVGMAIKDAGFGVDVFQKWTGGQRRRSTGEWIPEDIHAHWNRYNASGITWASVVHLARQNGYKPKCNHKPVKLHKKNDLECVIEPIEKARELLRQAFGRDENLIGFRADTGIGKNEVVIKLYQIKGIGGFISTPTTDLSKEMTVRLKTAGVDVFRWRGIHAEPDGQFPHEKPCMFPDQYTAYAESGRNAFKMLCLPTCPHQSECEQDGYLSQEAKAKAAQVPIAAHKDLLFNPLFRSTADRLLPQHEEDLIVIDEFNVFESFIEVKVTQPRLEYLRDTWCDHPLGDFAKALLNAFVVQNAPHTGITEILNTMSGTNRGAIIEALASYRVVDSVYTRKEAQEITAHIGQSVEIIENLPKIETESWNLLIQLEIFISRYHHAAGAPIEWRKDTLTFYLPPLPLYTQAKVICMSATLNQTFFEKAFDHRQRKHGDVGFIDADDTEWHPDAKVYQLRTNRNPRSTLLTAEKIKGTDGKERWHYTGFSATGQKAFDDILAFVKANPQRPHALISFKWVIETYTSELQEAGIITGHYGGLVGLDQHFGRDTDTPIFLHILGAPEIPRYEIEHRYRLLFGDGETPPDFARDDTTGEYSNKDVQAVYEACVKSEIMQAIGRAGLVKNPSDVILHSSHELPSVSHREQTHHFDEVDWAAANNNLDTLREVIAQRKAQEAAEAEAIASGDVQAVMEIKDVGKSQAYKDTKDTRPQRVANKKADRDAQVIGLHQQGGSLREIETATGIPRSTVSRIIKGGDHEVSQSSTPLYSTTYRAVEEWDTPTNPDAPCVESEPLHTQEPSVDPQKAVPPIPDTDYSRLDLDTAKQELVRCQERNNYNGAAFLRSHIQKRERQLRAAKKGASMDYYNILTIPGAELFAKISEINDIANDDTSPERDIAIDALNNLSTLLKKRYGSHDDVLVAPGKLLTFSTVPDSLIDSLPEK